MCGIVGMVGDGPVNQEIYDSLLLLQHRGQDSTGIATAERHGIFHLAKARGMVREAFRTRDMRGAARQHRPRPRAIRDAGHARASEEEAQPFYVNAPYGIVLVHNGNLTNTRELTDELFHKDRRHLNTSSDTELLVNVLANELQASISGLDLEPETVFQAVARVHERVEGSYAAIALISGFGLLAFRDPFGIRPLILGTRKNEVGGYDWMVASRVARARERRLRGRARRRCPARRCSSPSTASCTRSSAPPTRSWRRARSSTSTSPGPTRR